MRSTEITKNNHRKTCETVLARLIPEVDKYQPGKTKIFFRAGQVSTTDGSEQLSFGYVFGF